MPNSDHEDDEAIVEDFVNNSVVADPDSIRTVLTFERNAARWTRLVRQQIDRGADSLLLASGQTSKCPHCPPSDLDLVAAHSRPRSALTSSHGT